MVMRKAAARKKRARQEKQQDEPPEGELGSANEEEEDLENRPSDEQSVPANDEAQIPATNAEEAEEDRQASPQHSKQEVRNASGNEGGDIEAASAHGSPRDPFDELEEEEVRPHRATHHLSTMQVHMGRAFPQYNYFKTYLQSCHLPYNPPPNTAHSLMQVLLD